MYELEFVSNEIGNVREQDKPYLGMSRDGYGIVVLQAWHATHDCYDELKVWLVPKGTLLPRGGVMQAGEVLYLRGKTAGDFMVAEQHNTATWEVYREGWCWW